MRRHLRSLTDGGRRRSARCAAHGNVAHYTLGTTNTCRIADRSVAGKDGTGLPGTADLIGDPLVHTGIYALDKVDLFNLLSIPDATRAPPGDPSALDPTVDPNSIYGAAITYCHAAARHAAGRSAAERQGRGVGGGLEEQRARDPRRERRRIFSAPAPAGPARTTSSCAPSRPAAWWPGCMRASIARAASGRRPPGPKRR